MSAAFGRLAASLLLATACAAGAQTAALPLVAPAAVRAGAVAVVSVRVQVRATNLIPGSVNVQLVAANGQASVLGLLNDSGSDGDVQAGDGIYSGQVTVPAAPEGTVGIRVSFATRGSLKRTLSPVAALMVVPAGAPVAPSTPDLNLVTTHPTSGAELIGDSVNTCFVAGVPFGTVAAAAAAVGATPVGHVAELGNCWQLRLGSGGGASVAAAVAALAARSDVQFAEPEFVVRKQDSCVPVSLVCTDVNYRLVLGLAQAHNYGEGQGVIVGVLDTGMDATVIANGSPLFPNVVIGSNFITPGTPPVDDDAIGHGTIVAGILQAAAPGAKLFISKVLDGNSRGSETLAARGLRETALGGAKVINMSLGTPNQSLWMLRYLNTIQRAGIILVAAAGNEGNAIRFFPAAHVGTIAVGNTSSTDVRDPSSNFDSSWVNIAAPGAGLLGNPVLNGTSLSVPWVSGTVAMMLAKFGPMTEAQVREQLFRTALPIPANATLDTCPAQPCNQNLGAGRLDPSAALGAIRLTRVTAVGASGAAIIRTIDVSVLNAAGSSLFSTQMSFFGQSNGCQVRTVRNPPCIDTIPFDFGALQTGTYQLRLSFPAQAASFFGSAQMTAPGASFSGVVTGSGSINPSDPTRADFSLFGAGTPRTTIFSIVKP